MQEEPMEHVQEIDGRAEAEGRWLLATAFETAPAADGLAGSGMAGAELLRQVRRRTTRRRRTRALVPAGAVAALGGAAAVAVTLTATVASAPSAFAAVTSAAAKTSAESFQVTMNGVTTEPPRWVRHWGVTGEFDPSRGVGEETITDLGKTQVRYIGQHMYVNQDSSQAKPQSRKVATVWPGPITQPVTQPWVEAAIGPRLSASAIAVSPDFGQQESVNPGALLSLLKSAGTVTDEGPASGPGWTGTKYGFTVASSKDTATATGTLDVDGQGQVRRMLATLTFTQAGADFTCTEDVTFSNFGAPVTVTAPPPSQVLNLSGHVNIALVPW
jgi:hypothetical protein